jgi:hypothetical protein
MVILGILVLLLGVGGGIWGYDFYSKGRELDVFRSDIKNLLPTLNNVPDLTKFDKTNELAKLKVFLEEIKKENTSRAEEILKEINKQCTQFSNDNYSAIIYQIGKNKKL